MPVSFDQSLPMILHRTLDAVMPDYRELFARYNLTEQQWRVLRVLWSSKKVTSVELSNRTLIPAPSLVGVLDRLEKKDLVTRVRSVEDRRAVFVVATAQGQALDEEVSPQVAEIDRQLRASVTAEEWRMMEQVLEKISTGAVGAASAAEAAE
ncbi:MAG: MarR family transcriptional regulator [Rhizobiaceae bacterium]|nr:MarR family transcriptional regulator [Hyphomicrobiales bacterium]NRB31765.1 MarR family transcriptional regulator [Rhizobiaceae bacterium]